jgi:copper oxidase (laccase) domain-containing protein
VTPLRWLLAGDVDVLFSCRVDGDMRTPEARQRFMQRSGLSERCAVLQQVHGSVIVEASITPGGSAADGQVSSDGGLAVGVFGADCPGLVLRSPDAIGIAHCGWRGTASGIVAKLVAALQARSAHPVASWSALIGPGISGPRYEVDAPVLAARTWPTAALRPGRPGHAHLDLATAIAADCRACGLSDVRAVGICTADDPRLHSYRHDGPGLVQLLVAQRRAAPG